MYTHADGAADTRAACSPYEFPLQYVAIYPTFDPAVSTPIAGAPHDVFSQPIAIIFNAYAAAKFARLLYWLHMSA